MATFILNGRKISVNTADELVHIMHEESRTQAADDKAYMMDVSDRTVLQSGDKIRFSTAAEFVNDLVTHGLLEKA